MIIGDKMSLINRFKTMLNISNKEDIDLYNQGLSKSRNDFITKLSLLNQRHNKVTEEYFNELEEVLIISDIGVETVLKFIDRLKKRVKKEDIIDSNDLNEIIVDELFIIYVNNETMVNKINFNKTGPTVILFIGVNGVGKTTTIAKLGASLKKDNKKVLIVAADTFRAGAIEQLKVWAKRIQVDLISSDTTDPSSIVYDGIKKALEETYDVVLIDTAGRLQNKDNLMKELAKMNKVIGNLITDAPHETLLVIDATTGQNGISQAKSFQEITNITGIVLTKLDGTAKGGIVLAIKEAVNIPVKYVGLGEGIDDLKVFDIEKYIYSLFKESGEKK